MGSNAATPISAPVGGSSSFNAIVTSSMLNWDNNEVPPDSDTTDSRAYILETQFSIDDSPMFLSTDVDAGGYYVVL